MAALASPVDGDITVAFRSLRAQERDKPQNQLVLRMIATVRRLRVPEPTNVETNQALGRACALGARAAAAPKDGEQVRGAISCIGDEWSDEHFAAASLEEFVYPYLEAAPPAGHRR